MKNELFVIAGEIAQELGISKPFAYKLVRQINEELKEKGFITIAGRVSRKYYEEKFYGMAQASVRLRFYEIKEQFCCQSRTAWKRESGGNAFLDEGGISEIY